MRGPTHETLGDMARDYLAACRINGNVPRWLEAQRKILLALTFELLAQGVHSLQDAKPHHLTAHLAKLAEAGLSQGSVRQRAMVCRAFARWARKSGLCEVAPMADADLPPLVVVPLDLPPFEAIRAAIEAAPDEDQRDAYTIALACGLRRGELLALRWRDVDMDGALLRITPRRDWSPKSGKARLVGIPSWGLAVLHARREKAPTHHGPFLNAKGRPILHPSTFSHAWARLAARKGIPGTRFHDLRHAHATRALEKGATIREVQAQLGHSDIRVTERYLHLDAKSPARVALALE